MTDNFLTFDIEEWYDANYSYLNLSKYKNKKTNLNELVEEILEICSKYKVKATFFVLGEIAKKHPNLIKNITMYGHELASHGYNHSLVYNMTPKEFKNNLSKSIDILSNISGKKIIGYRAPSWSVNTQTLEWFYDVLKEQNIKYSSSIFPISTYMYGIRNFNTDPQFPIINGKIKKILEIPCSTTNILGIKMGFSGGFYFRLFPYFFIKNKVRKRIENNLTTIFYSHPREISAQQSYLPLNSIDRFVHYWGINSYEEKLVKIIKDYSPTFKKTLREYYYSFSKNLDISGNRHK